MTDPLPTPVEENNLVFYGSRRGRNPSSGENDTDAFGLVSTTLSDANGLIPFNQVGAELNGSGMIADQIRTSEITSGETLVSSYTTGTEIFRDFGKMPINTDMFDPFQAPLDTEFGPFHAPLDSDMLDPFQAPADTDMFDPFQAPADTDMFDPFREQVVTDTFNQFRTAPLDTNMFDPF